jgi:hypothetical protein
MLARAGTGGRQLELPNVGQPPRGPGTQSYALQGAADIPTRAGHCGSAAAALQRGVLASQAPQPLRTRAREHACTHARGAPCVAGGPDARARMHAREAAGGQDAVSESVRCTRTCARLQHLAAQACKIHEHACTRVRHLAAQAGQLEGEEVVQTPAHALAEGCAYICMLVNVL